MGNAIKAISDGMNELNSHYDAIKRRISDRLNLEDPIRIMPYRGYGNASKLFLTGRVLQDEGIKTAAPEASKLENLVNMYRRFETDEIPDARLEALYNGERYPMEVDEEGYFEISLERNAVSRSDQVWQNITIERLKPEPQPGEQRQCTAEVRLPGPRTKFGLISDIDDTIVKTQANDLLQMIRIVYLGNANTRSPFPHIASFYRALEAGTEDEHNLFFYVSSSPWNMYDLFEEFLDIHEFPKGPILLKDIELSPHQILSFDHEDHKLEKITPILESYPELPFILFGDSGQKDPEIYQDIVKRYGDRIQCVYIRDVKDEGEDRNTTLEAISKQIQQNGSELVVVSSTKDAVQHATKRGWILEQ